MNTLIVFLIGILGPSPAHSSYCQDLLPYTYGSIQSVDDVIDVEAPGILLDGVNRLVRYYDYPAFVMPEEEFLFLRTILTDKDYRRPLIEMSARTGKNPIQVLESLERIFRRIDPDFSALQVFDNSIHWRVSKRKSRL